MEETLEALNEVVRAGKALYIGASSMYAWQFAQMLAISDGNGWARFVTMQNHYNLLYREEEREMNPLCESEGVGLIPWSPLARGVLAGNRKAQDDPREDGRFRHASFTARKSREADQRVVDRLEEIGRGARNCRRRRSRWRGCCTSPPWSRRSWAPRSRTISTMPSPPSA